MRVAFSMSNVKRSIFKRNAVMEDAFAALKWIQSLIKMEPLNVKVGLIDFKMIRVSVHCFFLLCHNLDRCRFMFYSRIN